MIHHPGDAHHCYLPHHSTDLTADEASWRNWLWRGDRVSARKKKTCWAGVGGLDLLQPEMEALRIVTTLFKSGLHFNLIVTLPRRCRPLRHPSPRLVLWAPPNLEADDAQGEGVGADDICDEDGDGLNGLGHYWSYSFHFCLTSTNSCCRRHDFRGHLFHRNSPRTFRWWRTWSFRLCFLLEDAKMVTDVRIAMLFRREIQ